MLLDPRFSKHGRYLTAAESLWFGEIIELLKPDVLVKGADYDPTERDPNSKKYIVGSDAVLNYGGAVKSIELVDGFSTTALLAKVRK
jgi:bifunctional ADP-heptose synthase (sugar kinase/adenylyltransferase)